MSWRDPKIWLGLLSLAVVLAVVVKETERTSPGPLTSVHQRQAELAGPSGCDECHGGAFTSMAGACSSCHEVIGEQLAERRGFHGSLKGLDVTQCGRCHVEHHGDQVKLVDEPVFALAGVASLDDFEHDFVEFHLAGKHAELACDRCHRDALVEIPADGVARFLGLEQRCTSCHEDPHEGKFVKSCEQCHGQEHPFEQFANFVHTAELPLVGAHDGLDCAKCHEPGGPTSIESLGGAGPHAPARACQDCHESPHTANFVANVAAELDATPKASCSECHSTMSTTFALEASALKPELHGATGFPLDKPHDGVGCDKCHTQYGAEVAFAVKYPGRRADDCAACHADPHAGQFADARGVQPACTQCHAREHFAPNLFDQAMHSRTAFALDGAHLRAECGDCHAKQGEAPRTFQGTPQRCDGCHEDVHGRWLDVASPLPGRPDDLADATATERDRAQSCERCHNTTRFDDTGAAFGPDEHARLTGFGLLGAHRRAECDACHERAAAPDARGRRFGRAADQFGTPVTDCSTCHQDVHRGAFDGADWPRFVEGRATCGRCHTEERFEELRQPFDHGRWTAFVLDGAHASAECSACHGTQPDPAASRRSLGFVADVFSGAARECATCHADVHSGAFDRLAVPARVGDAEGCARCHTTRSFDDHVREDFDHGAFTTFALEGRHARAACEGCHLPSRAPDEFGRRFGRTDGTRCADCHADPHAGQFGVEGATSCERCHASSESYSDLRFDHDRDSRFALDARHVKLDCVVCHKPWPLPDGRKVVRYKPLGTTCVECHGFEK